jgi:uncharacterized protein YraI
MRNISVRAALLLATALLAGCGGLPIGPSQPASVRLIEPASGSTALLGDTVTIRGEFSGNNVAYVQVRVNGQEYALLPVKQGQSDFSVPWTPRAPGNIAIDLVAFDAQNAPAANSDIVLIAVEAPIVPPSPTPAPTAPIIPTVTPDPTSTPAPPNVLSAPTETAAAPTLAVPIEVAPTLAPTLISTLVPTSAPPSVLSATAAPATQRTSTIALSNDKPQLVISNTVVNLRAGPGTVYDLIGSLIQGQTAIVTGKSADGRWWRIDVDGKTAWVFAPLVRANTLANAALIASAPPLPARAPTTVPPSSPTAQATPIPTSEPCGPSSPYWAATLNSNPAYTFCTRVPLEIIPGTGGDILQLHWDLFGVESVELRIDPQGESCGLGRANRRISVPATVDRFGVNKKEFPTGGYKISLYLTINGGRLQPYGGVDFCGG